MTVTKSKNRQRKSEETGHTRHVEDGGGETKVRNGERLPGRIDLDPSREQRESSSNFGSESRGGELDSKAVRLSRLDGGGLDAERDGRSSGDDVRSRIDQIIAGLVKHLQSANDSRRMREWSVQQRRQQELHRRSKRKYK